jgi:hypothetical protein
MRDTVCEFFNFISSTVKPALNGISRVQNIFPLKPGFRLIKVYYDSHGELKIFPSKTKFRLIKGPFKTGFTVLVLFIVCYGIYEEEEAQISQNLELFKRWKQILMFLESKWHKNLSRTIFVIVHNKKQGKHP